MDSCWQQIDRETESKALVREIGFNDYIRNNEIDFEPVDKFWKKDGEFWKLFRTFWKEQESGVVSLSYKKEVNGVSYSKLLKSLAKRYESGEEITYQIIKDSISPYVVKN